jgi:hypothetical protein
MPVVATRLGCLVKLIFQQLYIVTHVQIAVSDEKTPDLAALTNAWTNQQ